MKRLPMQRWAEIGGAGATDSYKPLDMPFYAVSQGVKFGRGNDRAIWHVYCRGTQGAISGCVSGSWAISECDRLNAAVCRFFSKRASDRRPSC